MADVKLSQLTPANPANDWYLPATTGATTSPSVSYRCRLRSDNVALTIPFRDGNGDITTRQFIGTNFYGNPGGSSTFAHGVTFSSTTTFNGAAQFNGSVGLAGGLTAGGLTSTGNIVAYGTIYCANDIVGYWTGSDERYKDNKHVISNALGKLDNLNGYEFTYNDKAPNHLKGKTSYGVIAQEVEKVLPNAVANRESDGQGGFFKGVNYEQLVGVLLQAVKELKAEVADLKSKIK